MGKISKAISSGLSMFKLRKATADASQVLEGSTFYSGNKDLKKGIMPNKKSYSKVLNPGEIIQLPEGYYNGNSIMAKSRNIGTVTFHLPEKNTDYRNVVLSMDVGHTILGMATGRVINYTSCIWKEETSSLEWHNKMLVDLTYSGSTVTITVTIENLSQTVHTDLTFSYMY